MKYGLIIIFSVVIGMNIGHLLTKEQREVDPKVHVPGSYKIHRGMMEILGLAKVRRHPPAAREKSNLKQLGTTVAMYYTDGGDNHYPQNPQAFDFYIDLFHPRHLSGKYIELPQDWKIPDSWEKLNQSNSPFVFLRSPEDKYTGNALIPMFITRYGYQAGENYHQVVYEDGHVSSVTYDEAVELWKQAGVWNGN